MTTKTATSLPLLPPIFTVRDRALIIVTPLHGYLIEAIVPQATRLVLIVI
ncbi:hypothetical protein [Erythrobacter alti]